MFLVIQLTCFVYFWSGISTWIPSEVINPFQNEPLLQIERTVHLREEKSDHHSLAMGINGPMALFDGKTHQKNKTLQQAKQLPIFLGSTFQWSKIKQISRGTF